MKWTVVFMSDDCNEVQMFLGDDPQQCAIDVTKEFPFLRLVAAVKGTPRILPMDNARTAECGLQGWPE